MSSWRSFFSYNKYTQVASRAVRAGLKDTERAAADKRAEVGMKYQTWKDGKASESVSGRQRAFWCFARGASLPAILVSPSFGHA